MDRHEEDLKSTFGLNKRAPDEFAVPTRAPLSLPPDYSLRPPEPGAPRPNQTTARGLCGGGGTGESRVLTHFD